MKIARHSVAVLCFLAIFVCSSSAFSWGEPKPVPHNDKRAVMEIFHNIDFERLEAIVAVSNQSVDGMVRFLREISKGFSAAGYDFDLTVAEGMSSVENMIYMNKVYGDMFLPVHALMATKEGVAALKKDGVLSYGTIAVIQKTNSDIKAEESRRRASNR